MNRFVAFSLGGAVALLLVGSSAMAAPKEKSDAKKAPASQEGTHHLQLLGEGLHGNAGFHYGNHYNAYTMHTHPVKEGKVQPVAMSHGKMVTVLRGNPGFFYGDHYNMYTMHVGAKSTPAPAASSAPAPAAKGDTKKGKK